MKTSGRFLLVAPIALRDLRPAQADLPGLAGRQMVSLWIANCDFDMCERTPHRSDLLDLATRLHERVAAARFGQPVRINVPALREIFEELADPRFRRPLTAADDPTQARDVESGTIRMSQNGAKHDRRQPGTRQLLVGNRLQYAFDVEIAVNTKRASDPQHCDARQVECTDVVERTCHQQAVIPLKPERNDMIDAFPVEISRRCASRLSADRWCRTCTSSGTARPAFAHALPPADSPPK